MFKRPNLWKYIMTQSDRLCQNTWMSSLERYSVIPFMIWLQWICRCHCWVKSTYSIRQCELCGQHTCECSNHVSICCRQPFRNLEKGWNIELVYDLLDQAKGRWRSKRKVHTWVIVPSLYFIRAWQDCKYSVGRQTTNDLMQIYKNHKIRDTWYNCPL